MLSEEVKRYRELSGDNNPNTPISRIGGYLDGYEKAMEQKTGHWIAYQNKQVCSECGNAKPLGVATYCRGCGAKMQ